MKKAQERSGKSSGAEGESLGCAVCDRDSAFLRRQSRPDYESGTDKFRLVDLFCGCGGMSLGVAEGAHAGAKAIEIPLAVDNDPNAVRLFQENFPGANVKQGDVSNLFDRPVGHELSVAEEELASRIGSVDFLLSGAPCQGHSDLNNRTRRSDPRNALYLVAARAVEVLQPTYALFENVPAVRHDVKGVVDAATISLEKAGYSVSSRVVNLGDLGVPQTRRRHLLFASADETVDPTEVLASVLSCSDHLPRTVRWAIGDLSTLRGDTVYNSASAVSPDNEKRIRWLFENKKWDLPNRLRPSCHRGKHSYSSMYGRLQWSLPAQTITTGFGSMGQGRYVHPAKRRTLTPHEAARLQTFPDFFDFSSVTHRGALARAIGNAVPPLVTRHILDSIVGDEKADRR